MTGCSGITERAFSVLDENDKGLHSELVSKITNEPHYDAALTAAHYLSL
jgi:peroxiredoxin